MEKWRITWRIVEGQELVRGALLLHLVEHAHGRGDDARDVIWPVWDDDKIRLLGHLGQFTDLCGNQNLSSSNDRLG